MTDKSIHKNYVEGFSWTNEDFVDSILYPHKKDIFQLFSIKLALDAENDIVRGREKLGSLWKQARVICHNIHQILCEDQNELMVRESKSKIKTLSNAFLDMDYDSISKSFGYMQEKLLQDRYITSWFLWIKLQETFANMREISKEHTKVMDW